MDAACCVVTWYRADFQAGEPYCEHISCVMKGKCLTVLFEFRIQFSFWVPHLENMQECFSANLKLAGRGSAAGSELQLNACISSL